MKAEPGGIILLVGINFYFLMGIAYFSGFLPVGTLPVLIVFGLVLIVVGAVMKWQNRKR